MVDRWTHNIISPVISVLAFPLRKLNVSPSVVTVLSFVFGIAATYFIIESQFLWGLACIILNRLGDGIDGILARTSNKYQPSDSGGFLDIVLDFLFYSMIPLAFLINNPEQNAVSAGILIFSFVGTGSSFLAFAIMAEKHRIKKVQFPNKSIYFLGGITEGTETIICLVLFCLFPAYFPIISQIFAGLCLLTFLSRTYFGYQTIKSHEKSGQ